MYGNYGGYEVPSIEHNTVPRIYFKSAIPFPVPRAAFEPGICCLFQLCINREEIVLPIDVASGVYSVCVAFIVI